MNGHSRVIFRALGVALFFIVVSVHFSPFLAIPESLAANETEQASSFQLQPGNRFEVIVYREEDLSGVYEIDPSGKLTFPLIGEIQAAGLNIESFRQQLISSLKKYLVNPQVSISRSEGTIKSISVLGHVVRPGTYDFIPGSTLMRLISTAEGFAESANKKKIKIVRIINGEKEVIIVNSVDIINGKQDDMKIEPGDIIYVPESIF